MKARRKKFLTTEELGSRVSTALRRLEAGSPASSSRRETIDLGSSEIACAVADSWAALLKYSDDVRRKLEHETPTLADNLRRLEGVTRSSAMRKVRP